jgi:3-oxoacyl-[acyl-carrier protein] reductase
MGALIRGGSVGSRNGEIGMKRFEKRLDAEKSMPELKDKVALVTGGSRGIGGAVCLALAKAGARVAVNYRARHDAAEKVRSEIEALGHRAITVQADASRPAEVKEMLSRVEAELGSVSILVNNSGIARAQKIEEISETDWDELIDVNLKSAFLVTQAVLPQMRSVHWGRIINISSVAAQVGGVVGPHYAASKAGMIGLTHSYANLLAKEGITVNAIAPALIETDMVRSNLNAKPDLIPVGRFGKVDEVADVVTMLAGNGYITGQTINVNGGWYMSS